MPLSSLDEATVERLRPWRPEAATVLRVDIGHLERRLTRALSGPPERALGEFFLASGTSITFEQPALHSLAGG